MENNTPKTNMSSSGAGASAVLVCLLLFFATILNYMDRQTLAIAAPEIQQEFKFDNVRLGLLLSAFFYTYGIMQLIVGPILDRVNVRWGYAVAVAWWSLAGMATGATRTFGQLFGCRLMLGIGEAANWPAALRIVAQIVPPEKRSMANGFFNSGSMVGAIITPPLMIWISTRWHWSYGFIAIGLLGFGWVAAWMFITRGETFQADSVKKQMEQIGQAAVPKSVSAWKEIARSRRFWGLAVASSFGNPCYYFYSNWLPTYFIQERGLAFGMEFGGTVLVPYLGLGLGSMAGGIPVLLMRRRGFGISASRKALIVIATALMLLAASVPWVRSSSTALLIIFVVTISMGVWLANYLSFCQDVSESFVATVAGVLGSFGAFTGALLIWLTGVVSKLAGGFSPVFVALGVMPVVATLGIMFAFPPAPRTDQSPATARD